MSDIRSRLEEKARQAELLRTEIRSLQYEAQANNAQADLVRQEEALDAELARLEAERRSATIAAGGDVADALRAMEAAAAEKAALDSARPPIGAAVPTTAQSDTSGEKE
jgi:TolA-binding protein